MLAKPGRTFRSEDIFQTWLETTYHDSRSTIGNNAAVCHINVPHTIFIVNDELVNTLHKIDSLYFLGNVKEFIAITAQVW